MYGVPLGKIMLEVVKIMMMNELEILFLGSTLQEMKWKVTDPCLNDYVEEAGDVTPWLEKDQSSHRVQLSLLLIAYIVKIYLNEENSLVDFKIRDIIKNNFDRMYQTWVQKVQGHFKFNPKTMNRLFREFDTAPTDKRTAIVDYNRLVTDFFRQNDSNTYEHNQSQEEEQPIPQTFRQPSGFDCLPIQEEQDHHPDPSYRRGGTEMGLNRQVSDVIFTRRSSANEFFAPEETRENRRSKFEMIRNSSIDDNGR
jgi:hypothetical protein